MKYNRKKLEKWKAAWIVFLTINFFTIFVSPHGPSPVMSKEAYNNWIMLPKLLIIVALLGTGLYLWIDEKIKVSQEVKTYREELER